MAKEVVAEVAAATGAVAVEGVAMEVQRVMAAGLRAWHLVLALVSVVERTEEVAREAAVRGVVEKEPALRATEVVAVAVMAAVEVATELRVGSTGVAEVLWEHVRVYVGACQAMEAKVAAD